MDYSPFRSALLVGEADFSFTAAFSRVFQGCITATEYSSGASILNLYFDNQAELLAQRISTGSNANIRHCMASVDARLLGSIESMPCERWNCQLLEFEYRPDFWTCLHEEQQHLTSIETPMPTIDLVIFNCPHTNKSGKAPKLLRQFFQQVKVCIHQGRMSHNTVVELRLRDMDHVPENKVRVHYQHEQAALQSDFQLIGVYDNDMSFWERFGYEHRMTRRNATCRGLHIQVWRWRYCSEIHR